MIYDTSSCWDRLITPIFDSHEGFEPSSGPLTYPDFTACPMRKLLQTFIGKLLIHIRPHIKTILIAVISFLFHDFVARTRIELVFTG